MKKPHVTSVGIVPSRESDGVPGLQVVIKGKPAKKAETDPVLGPVERVCKHLFQWSKKSFLKSIERSSFSEIAGRKSCDIILYAMLLLRSYKI